MSTKHTGPWLTWTQSIPRQYAIARFLEHEGVGSHRVVVPLSFVVEAVNACAGLNLEGYRAVVEAAERAWYFIGSERNCECNRCEASKKLKDALSLAKKEG